MTTVNADDLIEAVMTSAKATVPDPDEPVSALGLANYERGARKMLLVLAQVGALRDHDEEAMTGQLNWDTGYQRGLRDAGKADPSTLPVQRIEVPGLAEILRELAAKASVPARVEVTSMPDRAHVLVRGRDGKPTGSVESDV